MSLAEARAGVLDLLHNLSTRAQLPKDFAEQPKDPLLYKLNVVRVAIAELARAQALPGASPESRSMLMEMVRELQAHPDYQSLDARYRDDNADDQLPDRAELDSALERVASQGDADDRFFNAFSLPNMRFLNGWSSPARRLSNYKVTRKYNRRVIATEASVEVDRDEAELVPIIDPRNWHVKLPTLWPTPTIFINEVPTSRDQDGTPSTHFSLGAEAPFFEQAGFDFGVLPITNYRNVLKVTIDNGGKNVKYRQATCLTSELYNLVRQAGGIDVDRGCAQVANVPERNPVACRLRCSKASRFDLPADDGVNKLFNDVGAVGLTLLIEMFVLYGAVA